MRVFGLSFALLSSLLSLLLLFIPNGHHHEHTRIVFPSFLSILFLPVFIVVVVVSLHGSYIIS